MNIHYFGKLTLVAATALLISACAQEKSDKASSAQETTLNLESQESKAAYAVGVSSGMAMAQNLATLEGTSISLDKEILIQAFADGLNDESRFDQETMQQVMNDFRQQMSVAMQEKQKQEQAAQAEVAAENLVKGTEFLEQNKQKEDVVTLPSGLQYKVLEAGEGTSPAATDRVKVHYRGTLIDGSQFDSSYDRGQPATFGVNQVISGWTEALQLMKEGAKWELYIPAELAYGSISRPSIPGNSVLLFTVELLEVVTP